jgi:hypothetical protein
MHYISDEIQQDDAFILDIFKQCIDSVECDYFYPLACNSTKEFVNECSSISSNLVLVGVRDCFNFAENGAEEPISNKLSHLERVLDTVSKQYPTKKFVIFHEYNSTKLRIFNTQNIRSVRWSNIIDEMEGYHKLQPIIRKNNGSKKIGISLNRQMRTHRMFLVSYLYGLGLDKHVHISAIHLQRCNDLMSQVPWNFSEKNTECRDIAVNGFSKMYKDIEIITQDEPYELEPDSLALSSVINNVNNFKNKLRHLYLNSFVEIITETLYSTADGMVTEKYLNSVYGCNFPIILSTPGTVSRLREIGFDVFDDIIDHSYDIILNPVTRLESAIMCNINLIKNTENTIQIWNLMQDRLLANIEYARDGMYKFYKTQILTEFQQAINERE